MNKKQNSVSGHSSASSNVEDPLQPGESISSVPPKRRFARPSRFILTLGFLVLSSLAFIAWALPTYFLQRADQALVDGRLKEAERSYHWVSWFGLHRELATLGQARISRRQGNPELSRNLLELAKRQGADEKDIAFEQQLIKIQGGGAASLLNRLPQLLMDHAVFGSEIFEAYTIGLRTAGDDRGAESFLDHWLAAAPNDARAIEKKAEIIAERDQFGEAEELYLKALKIQPQLLTATKGLASVKLALGKSAEAQKLLLSVLSSDPDDLECHLSLCSLLLEGKRDAEAEKELQEVIRRRPDNFAARHLLASSFSSQNRNQEVIATINPILDQFQDDISLHYMLGTAYSNLGEAAKAQLHLEKHLTGRKQLNQLDELAKSVKASTGSFEDALALSLGYLQYQWDLAEPWLNQAITLKPDSATAHRAFSDYYRKQGDLRRANDHASVAKTLK